MIDLAQIAYLAYAKSVGGKNYDMPTWDALPERVREAWREAARAVERAVAGGAP